MSWSVSASGKSSAVRTAIAGQLANCSSLIGTERVLKDKVAELVDAAVAAQTDGTGVTVIASGSMYREGTKEQQTLRIEITPLWNFVE